MKTVSLLVFFISLVIHLYASLLKDHRLRSYTKPFIISSLLLYYLTSVSVISWKVVLALIFSLVGDLLLIRKIKWLKLGGLSFMLSHLLFIITYYKDINFMKINNIVIFSIIFIFIIASAIVSVKFKKHIPKDLFYPSFIYLLLNGLMNCFALFRMINNPCKSTIITCIGALLFFISDSSLFFIKFNKNCKLKTDFFIMLTYSLAELLIVFGLI